jgi:S1/P1 Nuclease
MVTALLAADTDPLTPHDIANAATWADKYRDANIDNSRQRTRQWHFVDIELASPNFDTACFDHPAIPSGQPASRGTADDCVADKIQEFASELAAPTTDLEEQIVALKFLLHFVGDLHQPLHASDDQDRGGNAKRVSATGFKAGNLHHYWDTEFVDQLGPDAKSIASDLPHHPGSGCAMASRRHRGLGTGIVRRRKERHSGVREDGVVGLVDRRAIIRHLHGRGRVWPSLCPTCSPRCDRCGRRNLASRIPKSGRAF